MRRGSIMGMGFIVLGLISWTFFANSFSGVSLNGLMAAENPNESLGSSFENEEILSGDGGILVASRVRPASKKENPEDVETKKLPKAVPPGQLHRPSKKELTDNCNKRPNCRKKLQAIKTGKGNRKPRPAAKEDSPEDLELKKLPKAVRPKHLPGRQSGMEFLQPSETSSVLSWLNPLLPDTAYAQSSVSFRLTPGSLSGSNYMVLYGARVYWYNQFYLRSGDFSFQNSNTENSPYVYFRFVVPTTGDYLINVSGSRSKAKLRHQHGGPIIDTWDYSSQSCNPCNFLTAEYLEQGYHYFYFWPDKTTFYITAVSLESYP